MHHDIRAIISREGEMKKVKVKIRLLGNVRLYTAGQIVEVDEDEAAMLVSLGYAILEPAGPVDKTEKEVE